MKESMTETLVEEREDESAVELTKRLMKQEPTVRLRVTEREIKFMVYALEQVVQTADDIIRIYDLSSDGAVLSDTITGRYYTGVIRLYDLPENSDELRAQKRIRGIGKAMIRRLSGTLEGKKLHFNMKAWWQIGNVLTYLEKNRRRVKPE